MARIAGVDLPRDKRVDVALTYIYGIGQTSARKVVDKAGINHATRVKDLTEEEIGKITEIISRSINLLVNSIKPFLQFTVHSIGPFVSFS
jgi:small subunit ribosomal protein S13